VANTPGQQIDPRGPRFGAGITAVLLLVSIALSLSGLTTAGFVVFALVTLGFVWGTIAGIQRHPYGVLFKEFVRPRLAPATELEDATPPTFAQGVGLFVTVVGVILYLAHVPLGLPIAGAAAFIAAFLNSVFGYCLGCQIYLLLVRARVLGQASTPAV
jgi:hypothetical protein